MNKKALVLSALLFCVSFTSCNISDNNQKVNEAPMDVDDTCVVTWRNSNGDILDREIYNKGVTPEYKKETPTMTDAANNIYTFRGWTPKIAAVSSNVTYTADYKKDEALFSYELSKDSTYYKLIKCSDSLLSDPHLEIPNTYKGLPVKEISKYAFRGCKKITSVTIPETITYIGDFAFQNTGLTNIEIDDNIEYLGSNVFKDCKNLVKADIISKNINKIDSFTFSSCINLKEINLSNSISSFGSHVFNECESISSIKIPNKITSISNYVFDGCINLSKVEFESNSELQIIEDNAFSNTIIKEISLPVGIKKIGKNAFAKCLQLQSVSFNKNSSDVVIDDGAFSGDTKLSSFVVGQNVISSYGKAAFKNCSSLSSFSVGKNIDIIESELFCNCSSLANISFLDSGKINSIGEKAFYGCAFTSLAIPPNVTSIGSEAFAQCKNVKTFEYPGGDYVEGEKVYDGCENLTSGNIPASKTVITKESIGNNLKKLTSLSISNKVTSITKDAFSDCPNLVYNVYGPCSYLGNSSNKYVALIKVDPTLIPSSGEIDVHPNCIIFADSAFENCNKEFNITIPDNVINIGKDTFASSAITKLKFSDNCKTTSINQNICKDATKLTSIDIHQKLNSIDSSAFRGCSNISEIRVNSDNTTFKSELNVLSHGNTIDIISKNVKLQELPLTYLANLSRIGDYACSERYVDDTLEIPSNISSIGVSAFENCPSIRKIYFGNSENNESSNLVNVYNDAFIGSNVNYVYYNNNVENWAKISFGNSNSRPGYNSLDGFYLRVKDNPTADYSTPSIIDFSNSEITAIKNYSFSKVSTIQKVYLNKNITSIGDRAFWLCNSLTDVIFVNPETIYENSLQNIGEGAFSNCTKLTGLYCVKDINQTDEICTNFWKLNTIKERAFYRCTSLNFLNNVFVCGDMKIIGNEAFRGTKIDKISFYVSARFIFSDYCFADCPNLYRIYLVLKYNNYRVTFSNNDPFENCIDEIDVFALLAEGYSEGSKILNDITARSKVILDIENTVDNLKIYYYSADTPSMNSYKYWWKVDTNGEIKKW